MKKLLSYIPLLLLAMAQGCSSGEEPAVQPPSPQGAISFTIRAPQIPPSRSGGDFTINRIDLLVCDDAERILEKASTVHNGSGTYTAQVTYSNDPRIVHFIANYDWTGWNDELIGKDAREALAGISTTQFTAWKRIELSGGITQQQPFGDTPVEMICNMAKFTLSVQSGLENVSFAIYNYDRGTIATFNPRAEGTDGHVFDENAITVPADAELKVPSLSDFQPMTGGAVFTFERDNASAGNDYSCMIVKGEFSGQTTYYKIDIVNTDEERQDIRRNNSYHINVSNVTNIGHPDIESAIASAADNTNFSLDPSLEVFPSITDGIRKLEVDKNFIVVTEPSQSGNFTATYSVRSGESWVTDNEKMSVSLKPVEGYEAAVSNAVIDSSTGHVSVTLHSIPGSGELRSKIVVQVEYEDGITPVRLYRSVTVVVRPNFTFQAWQVGTVPATQGATMHARVMLPGTFPKELLPLEVRFKTANFFPAPANPMRLTIIDQTPAYIYTITERGVAIPLEFLSNRAVSAETMVVMIDYCTPVNMPVSN
ncbi:fimbria major subunit [Bacteroides pyogenes]|uniref:fimbria major subunit n=1 Tax=Bacteroides pyogenes TaxID=310300 RepID=UPI0011E4A106|nr:fimbria major subunit [Bacteroides pyogenes]TYK39533.1 hypothetical protein FNJ59_07025 [Bacteroides pyogenes]